MTFKEKLLQQLKKDQKNDIDQVAIYDRLKLELLDRINERTEVMNKLDGLIK